MLPFSAAMREREAQLRRAVVAVVVGVVSPPTTAQVLEALCAEFSLPVHSVSVRRYFPEEFLIFFQSDEVFERVVRRRSVPLGAFRLLVAPWTRQLHAREGSMLFRVRLHLEGIPGHAWDETTAAAVLGSSCRIASCDPASSSASDMAVFKLYAWTSDPASIPKEKWLRIVEDGGPVVSPQGTCERYLDYVVLIHLTAVEDHISPPEPYLPFAPSSGDSGRPSSGPDSDDGPPRRHFFSTSRGRRDGSPPPPQSGQGSSGGRGGRDAVAAAVLKGAADRSAASCHPAQRRGRLAAPVEASQPSAAAEAAMARRRFRRAHARRRRQQKVIKLKSGKAKLSPIRSCCRWQPRRRQTSEPVLVAKEVSPLRSLSQDSLAGQGSRALVSSAGSVPEEDSAPTPKGDTACQSPLSPDEAQDCCWRTDVVSVVEACDPMLEEASGFFRCSHMHSPIGPRSLGPLPVGLSAQATNLQAEDKFSSPRVVGPQLVALSDGPAGVSAQHDDAPSLHGTVPDGPSPVEAVLPVTVLPQVVVPASSQGSPSSSPNEVSPLVEMAASATVLPSVPPLASSPAALLQEAPPTPGLLALSGDAAGVVPVEPMVVQSGTPFEVSGVVEMAPITPSTLITFSRRAKKSLPPALLPPPLPQQPLPLPSLQTPRRSERQAQQAMYGAPSISRCQSVLAKKMGEKTSDPPVAPPLVSCTLRHYNELFEKELSQDQLMALADLFGFCLPPPPASAVAIMPRQAA